MHATDLATRCLLSASLSAPLSNCRKFPSSTAAAARPKYMAAFTRRSSYLFVEMEEHFHVYTVDDVASKEPPLQTPAVMNITRE